MIYTRNQEVLNVSKGLFGYMHNISSHTQYLLAKTFEDEKWIDNYVKTYRTRLTKLHTALKNALKRADISLFESQGTMMAWADFRKLLKEPTWEAEDQLWDELFKKCKWLVTRG